MEILLLEVYFTKITHLNQWQLLDIVDNWHIIRVRRLHGFRNQNASHVSSAAAHIWQNANTNSLKKKKSTEVKATWCSILNNGDYLQYLWKLGNVEPYF